MELTAVNVSLLANSWNRHAAGERSSYSSPVYEAQTVKVSCFNVLSRVITVVEPSSSLVRLKTEITRKFHSFQNLSYYDWRPNNVSEPVDYVHMSQELFKLEVHMSSMQLPQSTSSKFGRCNSLYLRTVYEYYMKLMLSVVKLSHSYQVLQAIRIKIKIQFLHLCIFHSTMVRIRNITLHKSMELHA